MDNSIYKTCTECGRTKHISEFSKSYPNRCKECVAEHTRQVRQRAKEERNGNVPNIEKKAEIDWEQRRYEIAKECVAVLMQNEITLEDAAKISTEQADALIAELKKGGEK